jgi:hypothetical protein
MGKVTMNGLESRVNKLFNLKYGNNVSIEDLKAFDKLIEGTLPSKPLENGIEFLDMHVVAILRNQGNGYHQNLHVDAPKALEVADDLRNKKELHLYPWKVGYIMMIPLSREGLALRLLVPKDKETDDGKHLVVRNIFVPYGTMIFIRADLFHSGCYGSCDNTRVHAMFVPQITRGYDNTVLGWIDNQDIPEIKTREFIIQQSSLAPHCMVPASIMLQHSKNVVAHISKATSSTYWQNQRIHTDGPLQAGYMARFFEDANRIMKIKGKYRSKHLDPKTRTMKFPKEWKEGSQFPKYNEEEETDEQKQMEMKYMDLIYRNENKKEQAEEELENEQKPGFIGPVKPLV